MPYAGPPCFLDDDLFELNSGLHPGGIFPDQGEALAWLADRLPTQPGACLLPGDRIALDRLEVIRDPHWDGFSLDSGPDERRRYLADYAARRRPAIEAAWAANPQARPGLADRFKAHLESLGTLSEYFLARIGMTLRFDVTGPYGGVWDAHIGPGRVVVDLDGGNGHADYRLTLDGRWLDGVVTGRTRWEELLLSLRFVARRQPDRYNDYLVGLLKHADRAALRAVERFEAARDPEETTEITVEGKQVQVSRYCPHAGEDLAETGVVVNGVLRCLGHNFEFDLEQRELPQRPLRPDRGQAGRGRLRRGRLTGHRPLDIREPEHEQRGHDEVVQRTAHRRPLQVLLVGRDAQRHEHVQIPPLDIRPTLRRYGGPLAVLQLRRTGETWPGEQHRSAALGIPAGQRGALRPWADQRHLCRAARARAGAARRSPSGAGRRPGG